jgi:transposase
MNLSIQTQNLDHFGIIAGIIDDLKIEHIVDSLIPKHPREKISAGQIVKAIIINGLGFLSKPLYLFSLFFDDKPVDTLLGNGIKAEYINDDKIGRVMDALHDHSLELLWTKIGLNTIKKFQLSTEFSHLDSSSISVEGNYNSHNHKEENLIHITHGYSKDKRPDLNQFLIKIMVSNDGDVATFMKVGSGNESDKKGLPDLISAYHKNINFTTKYVADSSFFTSDNLHEMQDISWISRVPMTIKKATEVIVQISKEGVWIEGEQAEYKYREKKVNYHGIEQRWLVVEGKKRKESDLLKLEKNIKKEKEKIELKKKQWSERKKKDKQEIQLGIKQLKKTIKYHQISKIKYLKVGNKKENISYSCEIEYEEKKEVIELEKSKAGKFILATNVLKIEELSSSEILKAYKNQQGCERGFRFIKDPLFLASHVYVKNAKRVEVMGVIMGLCLLVYSIGQRMVRKELERKKEGIKNQVKKLTSRPTLRWIFQCFQGIHVIKIEGEEWINNLNEERRKILSFMSENCRKYYQI